MTDCTENTEPFVITRGEDVVMPIFLVKPDGKPEPWNAPDEIEVFLPTGDIANPLKLTLTGGGVAIINDGGGEAAVTITDTESQTLEEVTKEAFEVLRVKGTTSKFITFERALTVKERLFPGT